MAAPTVKWKCKKCGRIRIMNAGVTLVLCKCNWKQMERLTYSKIDDEEATQETQQSL